MGNGVEVQLDTRREDDGGEAVSVEGKGALPLMDEAQKTVDLHVGDVAAILEPETIEVDQGADFAIEGTLGVLLHLQ